MVIVTGHVIVEPGTRDRSVEVQRDLVQRARATDGCLHVAIAADSVDRDRVQIRRRRGTPGVVEVARDDAIDGGPLF